MLKINKQFVLFFLISLCLASCKTSKEFYYSYNTEAHIMDSTNNILYFSSLLSFGDYLFEYKVTTHLNTVIHGNDKPVKSVMFDTTGIYLLSGKSKQYCEFDTFALQSKIISKGPFSTKPTGVGVLPISRVTADSSDTYYSSPKAISMNNVLCYYSNIRFKDKAVTDTMERGAILIKKENFNSFYKIRGIEFTDTIYCIVGFRLKHLSKDETFVEQINNLRPLTEKEIQICKRMVKASGL